MGVIIEPFRIKSVEPISMTTPGERAGLLGGDVQIDTLEGQGTTITLQLPR